MEPGMVTEESIEGTLRQISQRRRQGVLKIPFYDGRSLEVFLFQGKIVDASLVGEKKKKTVLEVLSRAGLITDSGAESDSEDDSNKPYREMLLELLETETKLDPASFKKAIKKTVLDLILTIDPAKCSNFTFKPQMVEYDPDFSLSLSAAQVLIDLSLASKVVERYERVFPQEVRIAKSDIQDGVLSTDEKVIMDLLDSPELCSRLESRSMLCRYHFAEALLSLHEKGLVAQVEGIEGNNTSRIVSEMVFKTVVKSVEMNNVIDEIREKATELSSSTTNTSSEPNNSEAKSNVITPTENIIMGPPLGTNPLPNSEPRTFYKDSRIERKFDFKLILRALEGPVVVQTIAVIFILIAFAAPWFSWSQVFEVFSH